jgi:hypothetical protein
MNDWLLRSATVRVLAVLVPLALLWLGVAWALGWALL